MCAGCGHGDRRQAVYCAFGHHVTAWWVSRFVVPLRLKSLQLLWSWYWLLSVHLPLHTCLFSQAQRMCCDNAPFVHGDWGGILIPAPFSNMFCFVLFPCLLQLFCGPSSDQWSSCQLSNLGSILKRRVLTWMGWSMALDTAHLTLHCLRRCRWTASSCSDGSCE